MNNASFHLSPHSAPGRHHSLLTLSNPVGVPNSVARLLSSTECSFAVSANNNHMMNSLPNSQISPLNFSQRDLLHFGPNNPALQYFNTFGGLPMLPGPPFGIFPHYPNFFNKSPAIGSPTPGFFNGFISAKDDDLMWQKRSPNNLPDSPLSTSRSSPGDTGARKKLCRNKSVPDHNACPICGQTVLAMTLQEHFVDEMRAYRQDPSKGRDVSSPAGSSTDRHARSTPSTPSEIESRVEIYLRVRGNRRVRHSPHHDHSKTRSATSDLEPRQRHSRQKSARLKDVHANAVENDPQEELEIVVDVETDESTEAESLAAQDLNKNEAAYNGRGYKRNFEQFQCEEASGNGEDTHRTCARCEIIQPASLMPPALPCNHEYCTQCFDETVKNGGQCYRCTLPKR